MAYGCSHNTGGRLKSLNGQAVAALKSAHNWPAQSLNEGHLIAAINGKRDWCIVAEAYKFRTKSCSNEVLWISQTFLCSSGQNLRTHMTMVLNTQLTTDCIGRGRRGVINTNSSNNFPISSFINLHFHLYLR